jgi:phage terminase Nu1 subunit (DNA packaging protein)
LGRQLGLSPAAITKLKKQGMPVHSVVAAQAWRLERQSVARRKATPAPVAAPSPAELPPMMGEGAYATAPSYNESRAKREAAEAAMAELRLAEERGDLVRVDAIRNAIDRQHAALREILLQLPARVVPLLVASPDAASIDQLLRAEILTALQQVVAQTE